MAPYAGTQVVTGHAVDDRWGQGLSKIGQAIIGAMSNKRIGEEEKDLNKQYDEGQAASIKRITEAMQPQPSNYVERDPKMIQPDYKQVGVDLATDPYLQNNDVAKALINAEAFGSGSGGVKPYLTPMYGQEGEVYSFNRRTSGIDPVMVDGEQLKDPRYTPGSQYRLRHSQQMGTGQAELATDPATARAVETQKKLGAREAEKVIDRPKTEAGLAAKETQTSMVDESIDKAKDQSKWWTTGIIGGTTSWVPGTPAHNLSKTLDTIKSNIGFDKLAEMRANSPTGGALGQVSDFENQLLQSVWGSLAQSQTKGQFEENLEKVRKQTKESWARIRAAYKKDYGVDYSGSPTPGRKSNSGVYDDAEKERRYQEYKARMSQ